MNLPYLAEIIRQRTDNIYVTIIHYTMNNIDKLIKTVPGLTLDQQFDLINKPKQTGMRLHTKRPGSMPFTF